MRDSINNLAACVGADPLLVQGAGGNISWKEGGSIFVKGSGTWLSDALVRDIYVEMDLDALRQIINVGELDYSLAMRSGSQGLRPSIETALHALLPFQVVLHIHHVDTIAISVMKDAIEVLKDRLGGVDWQWIEYEKPGKELAEAIAERMALSTVVPRVWVLKNHGLVIGEESVGALEVLLKEIILKLKLFPRMLPKGTPVARESLTLWDGFGYRFVDDELVHSIAFDDLAMSFCRRAWVLYPDHAVFLGPRCWLGVCPSHIPVDNPPLVVVVPGVGVCIRKDVSKAAHSMLSCYANVLVKLPSGEPQALSSKSVSELLNWDAEKARQAMQEND